MNVSSLNHISSLPPKIQNSLFFEYLDENAQHTCLTVDRKISNMIAKKLLYNLRIPIEGQEEINLQLLKYYKSHCNYFKNKVPNSFELRNCSSVTEVKQLIDSKLKKKSFSNAPILNEIWDAFIHKNSALYF